MKFPKVAVFDIDYTVWPFWVDTHVSPPFAKSTPGPSGPGAVDSRGRRIDPYPNTREVFEFLKNKGVIIAAASRTDAPPEARELLKILDLDKYFDLKEIYPGSKTRHFRNIRDAAQAEYCDMVFFDDEERNIHDISALGVTCRLVDSDVGVDLDILESTLGAWRAKANSA